MYIPSFNRIEDEALTWALMREFNFALLISAPDGLPVATPVPFTISEETRTLSTHIARANPQWQQLAADREVLVIFQGEHALVSPRWYENTTQVPTWNYATVHAYALPRVMTDAETRAQLEALMAQHSHAEHMESLPEDMMTSMQRGIVGLELRVTRLEGKLKLSQNKSAQDRRNVIEQLEKQGELERGVAARMRGTLE